MSSAAAESDLPVSRPARRRNYKTQPALRSVKTDETRVDREVEQRDHSLVVWASDEDRERRMAEGRARVRASRLAQGLPERIADEDLARLALIAFG
jgi:hypothetical protein